MPCKTPVAESDLTNEDGDMFLRLVRLATSLIPGRVRRTRIRYAIRSWHYGKKLSRKAKALGGGLYCGGPVDVYCDNVYCGEHVSFNGASLLGRGSIRIGDYFHSGGGLVVMTESHNYEGNAVPYDDTFIVKDVEIDECVWVGYGVTILPGTRIGKGAIVQARAVVHGEVPPYAIVGGNPAKVFAYRDKNHCEKLATERKFH